MFRSGVLCGKDAHRNKPSPLMRRDVQSLERDCTQFFSFVLSHRVGYLCRTDRRLFSLRRYTAQLCAPRGCRTRYARFEDRCKEQRSQRPKFPPPTPRSLTYPAPVLRSFSFTDCHNNVLRVYSLTYERLILSNLSP